jgi:hypothetical protein
MIPVGREGSLYYQPAYKAYLDRSNKGTVNFLSAHNAVYVDRKESVCKEGRTSQYSYDVDNNIVRPEAGDKDGNKQTESSDR